MPIAAREILRGLTGVSRGARRQGSSDELALLVAEYGLLDGQLASLVAVAERGNVSKIPEDILMDLASEIPDLRTRLGIGYVSRAALPPQLVRILACHTRLFR